MHIDMTRGRPLTCSKCGSTDAVKPLNSRDVEVRCNKCGHTKMSREAEQRELESKRPEFNRGWLHDSRNDDQNTF